eukprot:315854_1
MAGDQIETTKKGKTETIINKYSTVSTVCNDDEDEKNKKGKTHTIEPLVYSPVSHQDVRDDENKNGQIYLNIYRNDKPLKSWSIFGIADYKLKKQTKAIIISKKKEFDLSIIEKDDILEIKGYVGSGNGHSLEIKTFVCRLNDEATRLKMEEKERKLQDTLPTKDIRKNPTLIQHQKGVNKQKIVVPKFKCKKCNPMQSYNSYRQWL